MASLDLRSAVESIAVQRGRHENFYDHLAAIIDRALTCPYHARTQPQLMILERYTRSFFPFNRLPLGSRIELCRGLKRMRLNEGGSVAKHELEGLWLVFAGNVQVSRGRELHQLVAGDAFRPVGVKSTVWMCRALGPSTLLYLTPIKLQSVLNRDRFVDRVGPEEDHLLDFMGKAASFSYATKQEQLILARAAQKIQIDAEAVLQYPDHFVVILNGDVAACIPSNRKGEDTETKPHSFVQTPPSSGGHRRSFDHYTKRSGRSLSQTSSAAYTAGFAVSSRYTLVESSSREMRSRDLVPVAQMGSGSILNTENTDLVFRSRSKCSIALVSKRAFGFDHGFKVENFAAHGAEASAADLKRAFMDCSYSKFIPLHITEALAKSCRLLHLPAHAIFAEQGQSCSNVYIVLKGTVSLHVRDTDTTCISPCFTAPERFGPCVKRIESGGSIGEQEALRSTAYRDTCIAAGSVTMLSIQARTFRSIFSRCFVKTEVTAVPMVTSGLGRAAHAAAWLRTIYHQNERLMDLQEDTLIHLCQEAHWLDYSANEIIWSDSQSMEGFLLVLEGSVSIFRHKASSVRSEHLAQPLQRLRSCVNGIIQRQRLIKSFKPVRRRSIIASHRVGADLGVCVGLAFQGCAFGLVDEELGGRPFEENMSILAREDSRVLLMTPDAVNKLRSAMQTRITPQLERVLKTNESARTAMERQSLACFLLETRLMVEVKQRFTGASVEDLNRLCDQVQLVDMAPGETIFRQGQPCTAFFMILSGEVELKGEVLHAGDCIGHDTFASKEVVVRQNTATTRTAALLLNLSKRALENAKLHKTMDQEISGLLKQSQCLQRHPKVVCLLLQCCSRLRVERFSSTVDVVRKGDEVQYVCFLLDGSLILTCDAGDREINAATDAFPFLGLGEEAVCLQTTFKYTVKALAGTTLIKLPVDAYMNSWPIALRSNGVIELLKQSALFLKATKTELIQLAMFARLTQCPKNADIFRAGAKLTQLALIKSGECCVSHSSNGRDRTSRIIAKGDSFGEEYWEMSVPMKENLTAATVDVELLLISFKHLHSILLPPLRQSFQQISRIKREWAEDLLQRQAKHMRAVQSRQPTATHEPVLKESTKDEQSWLAKAVHIAPAKDRNRRNRFLGRTPQDHFTSASLSTSQTSQLFNSQARS